MTYCVACGKKQRFYRSTMPLFMYSWSQTRKTLEMKRYIIYHIML